MKSALYSLFTMLLLVGASSARAEKFLGTASGSIERLRCFSTFEGKQKDYVTIVRSERNPNGYVDALQLKGVWYDSAGKEHFAFFDVIYVAGDDNSLLVIGKSPERNALELNIPLNVNPGESSESTMKINAVRQDFLKFNCEVQRAG